LFTGFAILIVSAILGAIVPLPLRVSRRFHTEHVLVAGFGFATLVVPLVFAMLFIESWPHALQQAGLDHVLTVVAMGLGWGIGALCFGHGIAAVGIGIGLAMIMGINTVVGALVPMARQWRAIPESAKIWIFVGIAVCLAGVILCGRAGHLREQDKDAGQPTAARSVRAFAIGIMLCVVSGVMSACASIGFDYGQPIKVAAAELGTDERLATVVLWLPIWWGGGVAMVLWALLEIARQKKLRPLHLCRREPGFSAVCDVDWALYAGGARQLRDWRLLPGRQLGPDRWLGHFDRLVSCRGAMQSAL
jgi:L-rhamnose-H+ transport protein